MTKRIMVSGCSYTEWSYWPDILWPDHDIINLGRSAAGNRYISDSIIRSIDPRHPPDAVFALFTGVNRSDIVLPRNKYSEAFAANYPYHGIIGDSIYFFSGGDRYSKVMLKHYRDVQAPSWPTMENCGDFLDLSSDIKQECLSRGLPTFSNWDFEQFLHSALMLHYLPSQTFLQTQTYCAIIAFQDFLERHRIPYAFGFTYNPFDSDFSGTFGNLDRGSDWYSKINWDRWISVFPFETAMEFDLFQEDGVHLSREAQEIWAQKAQKKIYKEFDHV